MIVEMTLEIARGRIKSFTATGPSEPFRKYLQGHEEAGRLSYFGLGLNSKLKFGFTQDDKVLGGVEIGFGDNERKGGKVRAKGVEWWGTSSKATVRVGNETVLRNGELAG